MSEVSSAIRLLESYRTIEPMIHLKLQQAESIRKAISIVDASDSMSVGSPLIRSYARATEQEIQALTKRKQEIENLVSHLGSHLKTNVLIYKYFYDYRWWQIGKKLNISERTARRIHVSALEKIADIIETSY